MVEMMQITCKKSVIFICFVPCIFEIILRFQHPTCRVVGIPKYAPGGHNFKTIKFQNRYKISIK